MVSFQYLEPTSLEDAIKLLAEHGKEAKVSAGNTDLLPNIRKGVLAPRYLVGLGRIPGLTYLDQDEEGYLRVGAMTPLRELERSDLIRQSWTALAEAASCVGSVQIRNLATLGGNLCNASPAADTAPVLLLLDASVRLRGSSGERTIPLESFLVGPGVTCLEPAELLVEVRVPPVPQGASCVFLKHAIRQGPDCSLASGAALIVLEDGGEVISEARLALGAVAPIPLRVREAEVLLVGHKIVEDVLPRVIAAARERARPISDVRSSAWYRMVMVEILIRRAVIAAISRVRGESLAGETTL